MATKTSTVSHLPDPRTTPTVDQVGIEERVARIQARSIKKEAKVQGMELALSMIDLTTLEGADTPSKVKQLCYKGIHLHDSLPGLPTVAAICVYPTMVKVAKKALGNSGVKVASVSTAFPSGQAPKSVKIADTKYAVNEGADEIDMVISRGQFHSGDYNFVFDEIAAIKEACGDARLKVILETGELGTYDKVRLASDIAIAAGADFIKTSTGKINPAATMEVTLVMLHAIRDHYLKTGEMIAMKPAGGIRTSKQALHYLMMVKEELGPEWLSNHWFRFGASSLANDILMQLQKEVDGRYQSADHFSID
ncbi:MAG: deoxyribose-phosphate aldolase [Flavobacteriales bacterium]|nr:deoxyribose-phosphate aldolase [Flavobacteriales bacterium]MBK6550690.1 deoxyribose-phosphate aldolase [Flavobacteriales bacterium]MBK6883763.1 deoxyribose-phosphate aldolase [Flavobacteriales bacterium]MBK7103314.1 deoxyribose-phosphate aldolase [Flavobacteriales bacterium]MBK7112701.1 deoxyribose-phosphate aldolase [Flavobacteriales bacterium]